MKERKEGRKTRRETARDGERRRKEEGKEKERKKDGSNGQEEMNKLRQGGGIRKLREEKQRKK
jgi:hypothetical protein